MHLFTYGTLTIPEVMQAVTGQTFQATDALLPGYERFCLVDKTYPGIIKSGQHATAGRVYHDIDALSLQRLDYFEDDLYVRQAVTVVLPDKSTICADVYIVPPHQIHWISNQVWSEEYFRTSQLETFLTRVSHWMSKYNNGIQL